LGEKRKTENLDFLFSIDLETKKKSLEEIGSENLNKREFSSTEIYALKHLTPV